MGTQNHLLYENLQQQPVSKNRGASKNVPLHTTPSIMGHFPCSLLVQCSAWGPIGCAFFDSLHRYIQKLYNTVKVLLYSYSSFWKGDSWVRSYKIGRWSSIRWIRHTMEMAVTSQFCFGIIAGSRIMNVCMPPRVIYLKPDGITPQCLHKGPSSMHT
ncbi:hypothetical protein VNO77_03357 [Canavalia gladiata]|uniref:Uncharacterized protein n=1 Tax=Canavalia gladiata TaxID=3824 RepID=A0AAN9R6R9_CANGL